MSSEWDGTETVIAPQAMPKQCVSSTQRPQIGATDTLSQGPLSEAFRPFSEPNAKGSNGSKAVGRDATTDSFDHRTVLTSEGNSITPCRAKQDATLRRTL